MFINLKNNDLFIHIPKTAGTSITKCYVDHHGLCEDEGGLGHTLVNRVSVNQKRNDVPGHQFIRKIAELIDISGLNSFAVIRNPFELVVSHYYFSIQHPEYNYNESFEDFIKLMINPNAVRQPMLDYIADEKGELLVKTIIKYEDIVNDFKKLTNLDISEYLLNKSEHKHYSEYYDSKTKRIVEEYFKQDLEYFDYKFL